MRCNAAGEEKNNKLAKIFMTIEQDIKKQIERVNMLSERAMTMPGGTGNIMASEMRAAVRDGLRAAERGDIFEKAEALDKLAAFQQ
jgi:predicted transcriptional regulator